MRPLPTFSTPDQKEDPPPVFPISASSLRWSPTAHLQGRALSMASGSCCPTLALTGWSMGLDNAHDAVSRLWEHYLYEWIANLRGYLAWEQTRRKGGAGETAV